jgi:hypothetical protein
VQEPNEKDLLVDFERQNIPEPYKSYYTTKRHNLFATIQNFPNIWNCFMKLDEIMQREFEHTQRVLDTTLLFPMILYMNAHQKMRVALELGCSTCMTEAHSILRDAIESAAHAHRLASEPQLLKIWIQRKDDDAAMEAYKQEFEAKKATRLFNGLPELHAMWKRFSDIGSHTNLDSMVHRFTMSNTETDAEYRLNYLGGEPNVYVPALFEILLVFGLIEAMVFNSAAARLRLDPILGEMRARFEAEKESTRQWVIKTCQLHPPSAS